MPYCKNCGKSVSIKDVLSHYEHYHFGDFIQNEKHIKNHPEWFVRDARNSVVIRTETHKVKKTNETMIDMLAQLYASKCDKNLYRGKQVFDCACCGSIVSRGWIFLDVINHYRVCYDCFSLIREKGNELKEKSRKPDIIYVPMGGATDYKKRVRHK